MSKSHRTILVIDDTSQGDDNYELQLRQDPTFAYRVLNIQTNPQSIPALCRSHRIDCILLDLYSSYAKRLKVLSQLKQALGEDCPPIVVIGTQDVEVAVQALKQGAVDYLVKDRMTWDDLRLTMRSAIENAELRQELQQSQERFHTLAEVMPAMVWCADATGAVNYWNQHWYEYTGLNETESLGLAGASTVHPEERDRTLDQWSQAISNGETFEIEYRIRRWDGEYYWFICRGVPTHDPQGQITGWIGTIMNIDDQKQLETRLLNEIADRQHIEQDLRLAHAKINNILNSMTDAVAVLDRSWRFTYVNQAASDAISALVNLELEEWLGKSHWEIFPSLVGQPIEQEYCRAMAEQVPVQLELFYEPTGNWFESHAYPSPDGLTVYFRNIDDRKRVETALRESETKLQAQLAEIEAIYQSAPIGLNVLDQDLRFVRINQRLAEINGLSVEAHLGRTVRELLPDLAETAEALLRPIFTTGEPLFNVEIHGETPAQPGVQRTWLEHFLPLKQGDRVIGISTVCEEITERLRAERALKEANIQLEAAMAAGSVYTWQWDIPKNLVVASRNLAHLFGITVETALVELPIERFLEAIHPDDRDQVTAAIDHAIATGEDYKMECRLQNAAGESRWVIARGRVEYDANGVAIAFPGALADISERKQTEAALQQSESRFRRLIESNLIGVIFWTIDGGIFDANDAFLQMVGYNRSDLEAGSVRWLDMTPPEWLEQDYRGTEQILTTGIAGPFEKEYFRKDGTRVPVLLGSAFLEGSHEQGVSFVVDLSDRKRAEQCLRESEERLRLGMQVSGFALAKIDYASNLVELSPEAAALYGLPLDELVVPRSRIHATFHPDEQAELAQLIQQVVDPASSGWFARDHRVVWQTGEVRWLTVRKQVFFDRTQTPAKPTYSILVALDITERKQVEQERERLLVQEQTARESAERANRVKDEFLAVLSHELRTPLNPILGWATLLQSRQFDTARTAEALATIERNAKLQMQLIDDLLDIAKILRGKLSLNPVLVDLSAIVAAAIETVRTAATAKTIRLQADLDYLGQVMGDEARLQQIVWNLLSNAIKFTPNGGTVTVRLQAVDAQAELTITDTGKGIKPDFLPYLFESFRQEDASTTRQYGGLGLGLAIVRQLVEAHGGTIAAHSPGEGLGATFRVQLPLLNTETEIPQPQKPSKPSLDLTGIRVLAVDDDSDSRRWLSFLLSEYGAEVTTVASAAEVLAILDAFQPDILISDIGMPEMDGYVLMQQIRSRSPEQGGQVKAIALTAYAREEDQQRAIACGYQQHLTKPLNSEQLVQAVVALMTR